MKRRYKQNKEAVGRLQASYTVEAALLMPMILGVMMALVFCSFYLHDRAVLQGISCEAAAVGSNFVTEGEKNPAISKLENAEIKKRLLGSRGVSGSTESGEDRVTSSWNGTYIIPGLAMKYFADNRLSIEVSWTSERQHPVKIIRKIRGIKSLLDGGSN